MSQTDQAKNFESEEARNAIRAAKHRKQWGREAARKFCHNRGVHPSLYRLACQLEAIAKLQAFQP